MVALATVADKSLIPSLLEAPAEESGEPAQMVPVKIALKERIRKQEIRSVAARIAAARRQLHHRHDPPPQASLSRKPDELFFLIGIDAFREIAKWHEAEQLFSEVEFIVASRPGYSLADVANSLPEKLRPAAHITKPFEKQPARGDLVLNGATVHVLDGVHQPISATTIREAAAAGKSLSKFVDPAVADYIKKCELYKTVPAKAPK